MAMTPGGRKFTVVIVVVGFILFSASAMLAFGKLNPPHWLSALDPVKWIVLGYLGANVTQRVGESFGKRGQQ